MEILFTAGVASLVITIIGATLKICRSLDDMTGVIRRKEVTQERPKGIRVWLDSSPVDLYPTGACGLTGETDAQE